MDKAAKEYYISQGVDPDNDYMDYLDVNGVPNESADKVPRTDATWSDCNFDDEYDDPKVVFTRLICKVCKGTQFEVLSTGDYTTVAKCKCGFYYIVHSG